MQKYNPQKIEAKWKRIWKKAKQWKVDLKRAKKPYYNLMMFPYPSAEGLHVGNVYAFTGSDIYGRFRRMQQNDVFEPMGFDSFGIHSENYAIKVGVHPKIQTNKNIQNFRKQLKALGALFAWDHEVITSEPEYYKWTQWLFLQLYKAGLAYRAKAPVDWCPSCKTVLADEQVIQGRCERCDSEVVQKELEQWFFRITKYAEKLLKNLETIDWSERTKIAQRNWIGRSEGAQIEFKIQSSKLKIEVFTTRPDTLFGATYLVLSPEHSQIPNLKSQITNWNEVENYIAQAKKKSELERTELTKEKTGVELKGIKAINPANNEEIPVWIADYVLASYGTGAIMAVPAHDQRDLEFATKYNLPIKQVVCGNYPEPVCPILAEAYLGPGHLVGSDKFDGMEFEKAKWEITKFVGGKKTINYHLRDWLISRQRYWGPPIPIIYCDKCGTVPVPEKDLPVLLPNVKEFRPTGTGKSPLASVPSFVNTKCPQCKGPAERETDVSDTFLDSSWYFFGYLLKFGNWKLGFGNSAFSQLLKKWCPVDMYIGGQEHAVLHLLYTRFITMALKDMGFIDFKEPFKKFRAHGLLTKDGAKMSKSKGNVVNPDEYFAKYGADTVRMYLMFLGPFSEGGDWSDKGIVGIYRFLNRIWNFQFPISNFQSNSNVPNSKLESLRHKTIKKVTEDLENLRYNTAIAALMEYFNEISNFQFIISKQYIETLLVLLAPFAPHIAEELWSQLRAKGSVHNQPWPSYSPKLIKEEKIRLVLQVNGRVRDVIEVPAQISEGEAKELALRQKSIQKWIEGKQIQRVIFIPQKLLNIVA
ncbi:MAG: leucine--tRNA ligase [Candidatus Wildermuthbacteria bacterium]|nr:leucine--tRNA ligase [Candidatus Wildermuthbacteria bacterium]